MQFYEVFIFRGKKSLDPVTIALIVTAIVSFLNELRKMKEAGQPIPDGLEGLATAAVKVNEEITTYAENEAKFMLGDFLVKNWLYIAYAVLGIIVLRKIL